MVENALDYFSLTSNQKKLLFQEFTHLEREAFLLPYVGHFFSSGYETGASIIPLFRKSTHQASGIFDDHPIDDIHGIFTIIDDCL